MTGSILTSIFSKILYTKACLISKNQQALEAWEGKSLA
jgi:hypothetical protein